MPSKTIRFDFTGAIDLSEIIETSLFNELDQDTSMEITSMRLSMYECTESEPTGTFNPGIVILTLQTLNEAGYLGADDRRMLARIELPIAWALHRLSDDQVVYGYVPFVQRTFPETKPAYGKIYASIEARATIPPAFSLYLQVFYKLKKFQVIDLASSI